MAEKSRRDTLDDYRKQFKGKVAEIVLCKYEMFYQTESGDTLASVYPATVADAEQEAEYFDIQFSEQ